MTKITPSLQPLGDRAHPGARGEADLALVGGWHLDFSRLLEQLAGRGSIRPAQTVVDSATPRSMMPFSRQATTCTGIASTTSLAITTPRKRSGRRSSHCARDRRAAPAAARAARARFEDAGSRRHAASAACRRARRCRRRTRGSASSKLASCRASVRPKSAPSSGAVTKSPSRAELARAARVVAQARLVQRELHVAGERDPAAGSRRSRSFRRRAARGEFNLEFKALMNESLAGKVALVTGGARRVGAAIARRLHAAGANVLLHYRDSEADAAKLEAELNAARAKSAAQGEGGAARADRAARAGRGGAGELRPARHPGEQRLELLPGRARRRSSLRTGRSWSARTCARRSSSARRPRPSWRSTRARSSTSSTSTPSARSRAIRSTASPRRASRR